MATTLTPVHRIINAVTLIGTSNGTKIKEPDLVEANNEKRSLFFDQWAIITEFLVASTIKKMAETREEKARARLKAALPDTISKMVVGDKKSVVRGNVAVEFSLRNGRKGLQRAAIISELTAQGWKLEKINEFLEKVEVAGQPALYISASTTAE